MLELYDLNNDPGEQIDLSAEYPEIVLELQELLESCRVDLGDDSRNVVGTNCRLPGRVETPTTLTTLENSNPVYWAEYDTDEYG